MSDVQDQHPLLSKHTITHVPYIAPIEIARAWKDKPYLSFLDSAISNTVTVGDTLGRWSFIAANPCGVFKVIDGVAYWQNQGMHCSHEMRLDGSPIDALRTILKRYHRPLIEGGPPFQGGAIGVFAYDAMHLFEKVPDVGEGAPLNQITLAFYDRLFACDVVAQKTWWIAPEGVEAPVLNDNDLESQIAPIEPIIWQQQCQRDVFEQKVANVIEMIRNGDVFQVNLAHHFVAKFNQPPQALSIYERLRLANPAPFCALLTTPQGFIASTSPERFLKLTGRHVETRPIKGTRKRYHDKAHDDASIQELAASEKDRAENIMIVDLLRNDLSRVCEPHHVDVPQLCAVESYASVHHLVSVVTGKLALHHDALDVFAATFAGGSITGAPKIKAMEIIARLESVRRGAYCGAIGYIDLSGDMDFNIVIRTLVCEGNTLSLHAGGGITLLSDPVSEYDETMIKAEKILNALGTISSNIEQT